MQSNLVEQWFKAAVFGIALSPVFWAGDARCAEPDKPTPLRPDQAVDVVVLNDGSRFRGMISEMSPSGPVTMTLLSGETKVFPRASVRYAGPASGEPEPATRPAPPPPTTPTPGTARGAANVHFTTTDPGGTVYVFEGRAAVATGSTTLVLTTGTRLCTAPCNVAIQPGNYTFGVRRASDNNPVFASKPIVIEGDTEVRGTYVDRSTLRWGLVLGGIGASGIGIYMYSSSKKQECSSVTGSCIHVHDSSTDALSFALVIGGTAAMTYGFFVHDYATFEIVKPGSGRITGSVTARVSPIWRPREVGAAGVALAPSGLALSAVF